MGDATTSLAVRLLDELAKKPDVRMRFARILAVDITAEETLRSLLLEALIHKVATKEDLREPRTEFRREIESIKGDPRRLEERLDSMIKWVIGLLASIWLMLVALLLPIILKLLATVR